MLLAIFGQDLTVRRRKRKTYGSYHTVEKTDAVFQQPEGTQQYGVFVA
jgi:hypothetical protein